MDWNVIRAAVHTRDGEAGRVSKVVMDPETRLVTHLVVHEGVLFGREVVVPTTRVRRVLEGDVWLALDHDELADMPDFDEGAFEPPPASVEIPIALPFGGVLWPRTLDRPHPAALNAGPEGVRLGEVALDTGTAVACSDGPCGRVERLLVDEVSHRLTGFVIRQGLIFHRLVEAPVSWIDHVDGSGVHLKLTRRQVAELAGHRNGEGARDQTR